MGNWIKRLLFILLPVFCAFECEGDGNTSYYVRNSTEETVMIKTGGDSLCSIPVLNVKLEPGEMVTLYRIIGSGPYVHIALKGCGVSLSSADGVLLRFWTDGETPDNLEEALEGCYASYFDEIGVRDLHDPGEWSVHIDGDVQEYVFDIYQVDLVPLSEFVDKTEE